MQRRPSGNGPFIDYRVTKRPRQIWWFSTRVSERVNPNTRIENLVIEVLEKGWRKGRNNPVR